MAGTTFRRHKTMARILRTAVTVFLVMSAMLVVDRMLGRTSDVSINSVDVRYRYDVNQHVRDNRDVDAYVRADAAQINSYNDVIATDYPECPESLLTLITSFKPTMDKVDIYRRTIDNWSRLRPYVQPILFKVAHEEASEQLLAEARSAGWIIEDVPELGVNSSLPVFRSLFIRAMQVSKTRFYGFANGDIVFPDGLLETLCYLQENMPWSRYMLTARRINVNMTEIPISDLRDSQKMIGVRNKGRLFIPNALDLFVVSADSYPWHEVPPFVIGRIAYDNWLLAHALMRNISVVDVTRTVPLLHQTDHEGNNAGRDKVKDVADKQRNVDLVKDTNMLELGRITCSPYITMFDAFKRPGLYLGDMHADRLCVTYLRKYGITAHQWKVLCPTCKPITNTLGEWH